MKWANKILLSPYFFSLIIAIIIILFLPPVFDRFRLEHTGSQEIMTCKNPDSYLFFRDIDGDGRGEKIDAYYEGGKRTALQVFDHDGAILDQWNFRGKFLVLREKSVVFNDLDKDGITDILVFTANEDSIFFSRIGKYDGSFRIKERLLSTISRSFSAEISFEVVPEGFYDLNGDGSNEMIVSVLGARSLQPRQIMAYDFRNDSLSSSGSFGVVPSRLVFCDLDHDGNPEVTGGTGASGNVPDSLGIPYSDYSAWLMVFDHNLQLKFEPVAFPGFRNELNVVPIKMGDREGFAALLNPVGPAPDGPLMMFFSPEGKIIHEEKLGLSEKRSRLLMPNPFDPSLSTLLITEQNEFTIIGNDLKVQRTYHLEEDHVSIPLIADLEDDSGQEMIFTDDAGRRLFIYHSFGMPPLVCEMPQVFGRTDVSFGRSEEGKPVIVLQGEGKYQLLAYSSNPLFYLRWLIYLGIYLGLLLFILAIRRLQRIQMERNQAIRDQIRELQLKTIHNQLDPHFTFNVFNSIAHIIRTEERDSAYRSFLRFTGIVRATLMSSDRIVRNLEEEIQFVENYLELEKLRYKERLNYEIITENEVDLSVMVPKMILQIFVENAVKHGIRHKPEGGRVTVNVKVDGKKLVMIIEDDGIGREKAKEFSGESTGMGLLIMDRYIELFNQLNRQKIEYRIEDKEKGTRVVIDLGM